MVAEIRSGVEYFNHLSVREITDRFQRWYQAAHAGTSVDELVTNVRELCKDCFFQTLKVSRDVFFRARQYSPSQSLRSKCDLWHPPSHAITSLGRANRIASPMLYLAQDGRTALFESRLLPGERVGVAEITIQRNCVLNLQHVGAIDQFSAFDKKLAAALSGFGFTKLGINNINLIHRLLGEEFMRDVTPGNEQDYAITVAIAEFLLSYPDSDGLVFPSKKSPNDFNIALKPDAAEKKLSLTKCVDLEITDSTSQDITFRYINASREIQDDGTISWLDQSELPELGWKSATTGVLLGPFKNAIHPKS